MCAVSLVVDAWRDTRNPNFIPFTLQSPDADLARQMLEVIRRLDAIDKKLGLKDCKLSAATKDELIAELERRIDTAPAEVR